MSATTILLEVQKLHGVSDRLRFLAGHHPVVSEGLLGTTLCMAAGITSTVSAMRDLLSSEA